MVRTSDKPNMSTIRECGRCGLDIFTLEVCTILMALELRYCENLFNYSRRESREVTVGNLKVGGGNPVVVQSMITSDTRDTQACVKEVLQLADAGCEVVRITAQTRKYAENLENIRNGVRAANCGVPLVADIHFKPDAAFEAAKWVEKVRVNPGITRIKKSLRSGNIPMSNTKKS